MSDQNKTVNWIGEVFMTDNNFDLQAIINKLDDCEQQAALYEERIYFLSRLLRRQQALLKNVHELKTLFEADLLRVTEAEVLYGTDR
jgi:hypothetical protein